ncbi:MAG: hypothetical protein NVS1B11_16860 [Terriglobales bacterium]
MDGFIEPNSTATVPQSDSILRPVLLGVAVVVIVAAIIIFFLPRNSSTATKPDPYAAKLKLSDLKMSAAENFVGATVTYIDGNVTNTGDKVVTHSVIHVVFQDSLGQNAQVEDVPLHVLQTGGPYLDTVDLSASPLQPGQSKPFRLTFEHISGEWNQAYPDLRVTSAALK